jgi:hypothetical protein
MEDASTLEPQPQTPDKPTGYSGRTLLWAIVALVIVSTGISGYTLWALHKANETLNDMSFSETYTTYAQSNDLLTPDVGVIQFLHRGYSITFDSVSYTPSGLELAGTVGNPLQITVSSLNLKISARPPLYQVKDKVTKDPFFIYNTEIDIGSGQTTVPILLPGTTQKFSMTIPNVKQTSDGLQLAVSFSGERYAY